MHLSEFVFFSNRGSAIFNAALAPLGGRQLTAADDHIDLLYFDSYGGNVPPAVPSVAFTLIDRQRTIPLDNKAHMARLLQGAGLHYPRVYFDPAQVPPEADKLWYIKDPTLSGGKGISVVRHEQLVGCFKRGNIIQEAVQDLLLWQNRKFTLRAYVLVHAGNLYLFPLAITVLHGADYDPVSQDPLVQYQHIGYMDADSPVTMHPFAEYAGFADVMERLALMLRETFPAFRNLLKYEKAHTYCLFGIDTLARADGSTVLIEINDRPNIVHTRAINEQVNIPMVRAMYCVLDARRAARLPPGAPRFELIAAL